MMLIIIIIFISDQCNLCTIECLLIETIHTKDGRPRISFRCFMFLAGYGTDNLLHYSYLKKWVKLDRITGYVGMDNVVVVEHSERKERRKKN